MKLELRPHQKVAKDQLKNGSILHGGVGSGKTITSLAYYMENEKERDIYVITTARKRDELDWEKEASLFGITRKPGATLAGILTVDSWHNIKKYIEVEDAFFIFDEQKLVGNGTWVKSFQKIAKKNRWILLTATPGDTWMDYAPVFIANGLYKNITQFKREHVVYAPYVKFPKIMKYINTGTLNKYRSMLLVEMPYVRHTKRRVERTYVDYDEEFYNHAFRNRWNPYTHAPCRDIAEMFRVLRRIASEAPERVDKLLELLEKHKRLVVFYNFDYELEILRGLSDVVTVKEWNGHQKHPIPKSNKWIYAVQYTSGAEGWNCIETDTVVFWSLQYSWKIFEQCQGRIDRMNTPYTDLFYYVLCTKSRTDSAIWDTLERKETFNESAYASKMGFPESAG